MTEDVELRQNILGELAWEPHLDATHIGVTAVDGVATLTGHVRSFPEIFLARTAARRVAGVRAVADELHVRLPSAYVLDDTTIAKSIVHVLLSNLQLSEMGVQADVSDGMVTLTGTVDSQEQRQHAENQVAHVVGVTSISYQIVLRTQVVST